MPAETIAFWTLAGYCLFFAGLVLWCALRCPQGWRLWMLHHIDVAYCRVCHHWRANRPCPFLDASPAIIMANHRCVIDPGLIWAGVTNRRPLEFLTAGEYFGIPVLSFIFRALRAIPVARNGRDMTATRTALRRLKEGRLLGVFPEGRFNTGPGLLPATTGIAWLALQSRAPVYPVFIHNAPRGKSMIATLFAFGRVRITFGDPVDLSEYYGRRTSDELLQEVTDLLMGRLAALGGFDLKPNSGSETDHSDRTRGMPSISDETTIPMHPISSESTSAHSLSSGAWVATRHRFVSPRLAGSLLKTSQQRNRFAVDRASDGTDRLSSAKLSAVSGEGSPCHPSGTRLLCGRSWPKSDCAR